MPRPLNAARQRLAARYLDYARALARPYQRAYPRLCDELESAAALGLVHAAGSYERGRTARFKSYATHFIEGQFREVLQRANPLGFRTCDGDGPQTFPIAEGEDFAVESRRPMDVLPLEVERALSRISPRKRLAIMARFGIGRTRVTLEGLAVELGVGTKQRAQQVEREAIDALRSILRVHPA